MTDILEKDVDLPLPGVTVLKASAGSGKTHCLTKRLVQLLLSEKIPHNRLRHILALTFSNNAALEMRQRALQWLKDLCFDDKQSMDEIEEIVSLDREALKSRARRLVEEILESYTDFQVRTIDSFMTSVFKASAIDLGYAPEFEIVMESESLMDYAFDILLRDVRAGSERADLIEEVTDDVQRQRGAGGTFIWDPSQMLLDELREIDGRLATRGKTPLLVLPVDKKKSLEEAIFTTFRALESAVRDGLASGLDMSGGSTYARIRQIVVAAAQAQPGQGLEDLCGIGMSRPPVKKHAKNGRGKDAYDAIAARWADLGILVSRYTSVLARCHYAPFLKIYEPFTDILGSTKKRLSRVFIEDINRVLATYLESSLVPDVYVRLGDRVYHYLIDEFQDTSPVQWRNIFTLIEESLSRGGSLFVVGDTKQAIYAFRDTDYRIMRRIETTDLFPSAPRSVRELDTNYRSTRMVLDLSAHFFRERLGSTAGQTALHDDKAEIYRQAASESGLSDYTQHPQPDAAEGYAEINVLAASADEPPEREKILAVISDLTRRGYRYGDIAVLAPRNEDVVRITGWLSEKHIPFLSFSSLDVRRRKLTGDVFSLLRFLDSPIDDISFASFILGDVFARAAGDPSGPAAMRDFVFRHRATRPLYKVFQREFSGIWETCFSSLFRTTGYLPLYDLLCAVYTQFSLFRSFAAEEATLAKILDAVKSLEGRGLNSLREFLDVAEGDDEGPWMMEVPVLQDAVQVMTIHKSKGLGFPAVITVVYEKQVRINNCVIEDAGDSGMVSLVRVTDANSKNVDDLRDIYEAQVLREYVNSLNTLYVGTTRAMEEFYLIGVKDSRKDAARFPVNLLEGAGFGPSPVTYMPQPRESEDSAPDAGTSHVAHLPQLPAVPWGDLNIAERRRGVFMHRILRDIIYERDLGNLPEIIAKARSEQQEEYPPQEVAALIQILVTRPDVSVYFLDLPGRTVMIEKEFADARGVLYRMDRVIIDSDGVTVIDFKTGSDTDKPEHFAQVNCYMTILRSLFPGRTVRGFIAYIDSAVMRAIP